MNHFQWQSMIGNVGAGFTSPGMNIGDPISNLLAQQKAAADAVTAAMGAQQNAAAANQAHGLGIAATAKQLGITPTQLEQEAAQAGQDPIVFGQNILTNEVTNASSIAVAANQIGMTPQDLITQANLAGLDPFTFAQNLLNQAAANSPPVSRAQPNSTQVNTLTNQQTGSPGTLITAPTPLPVLPSTIFGLPTTPVLVVAGLGLGYFLLRG